MPTATHRPARRNHRRPPVAPPLEQLYVYLTEGCNLACRHCWLAPKLDRDGTRYATLPVDAFRRIVGEARPLGLQRVKFTGGEPLLHPHFAELLDVCGRERIGVTVETNGVLCTADLAARIAAAPGAHVSVSLDGTDARTHERIRGVRGSFAKSCRAVRRLARAGLKPQIIMTLMRDNAGQADGMIGLARRLRAGSVKFNIVQPTARGRALRKRGGTLSVAELIRLGRHVDREVAPGAGLRVEFDYPPAFRPLRRLAEGSETCGILGILGVLSTGHYALCGIGMHVKELVFGEAGKDNLADLWEHNPVLRSIRAGLPARLEGVCGRCLMRHRCLGSCVAQNYYGTHSLWKPFWFCREAERSGLFPASRLSSVKGGARI